MRSSAVAATKIFQAVVGPVKTAWQESATLPTEADYLRQAKQAGDAAFYAERCLKQARERELQLEATPELSLRKLRKARATTQLLEQTVEDSRASQTLAIERAALVDTGVLF